MGRGCVIPRFVGPPPGWYEMNVGWNESTKKILATTSPPAERRRERKQVSREATKGWANAMDETSSCNSTTGAFEKVHEER